MSITDPPPPFDFPAYLDFLQISSELGKKRGLKHPDLARNVGFLTALESNSNTLIQYISGLPEVESGINNMRRVGSKATQYSEIAKQYIRQFNLTSNHIPTLINFMLELNSVKYSGSKEEHALKVLEKY
jgi:hypothetical protein